MDDLTRSLWAKQDQHAGDRLRLFTAVAEAIEVSAALYPGSYVDIAPSFVFPAVTYVDVDRRAKRFFSDVDGINEIIATNQRGDEARSVTFIAGDYQHDLGLADQSVDLLISLYAGLISEHCTHHLRIGGSLLVNPSHGDVAMASIDPRYRLCGVVKSGRGTYRVDTADLDTYLVAKKPQAITKESVRESGRGIGYTKSPFAYLFERVA